MITCRGHTGPACSYSPCSSIREHREAIFLTDPYGLPVARVGARAPALRSRVEEACGPPGEGRPATRRGPLGSASSDNGRADRHQRPAVRPEDRGPARSALPAADTDGGTTAEGPRPPTLRELRVGPGTGSVPGWDAGSGPRPTAAVRTPSDRLGEASRPWVIRSAAGGVP